MSHDRNAFPASFPIARLERRTSAKGNEYFSGFLGGARVSLIKSNESGRDDCEMWHLMIAEGKMFPPKGPLAGYGETRKDGLNALRDYAKLNETAPRFAGHRDAPSAGPSFDQSIPF